MLVGYSKIHERLWVAGSLVSNDRDRARASVSGVVVAGYRWQAEPLSGSVVTGQFQSRDDAGVNSDAWTAGLELDLAISDRTSARTTLYQTGFGSESSILDGSTADDWMVGFERRVTDRTTLGAGIKTQNYTAASPGWSYDMQAVFAELSIKLRDQVTAILTFDRRKRLMTTPWAFRFLLNTKTERRPSWAYACCETSRWVNCRLRSCTIDTHRIFS